MSRILDNLRVVTLWRPWGWPITRSTKRVENRERKAPLPCPWFMVVREGQKWGGIVAGAPSAEEWLAGRVVGIAEVTGYVPPRFEGGGEWRNQEAWGWMLGRVVPIEPVEWPPKEALKARCMQGLVPLRPDRYDYDGVLLAMLRCAWRGA